MFDYWSDPSHKQASTKGKEMNELSTILRIKSTQYLVLLPRTVSSYSLICGHVYIVVLLENTCVFVFILVIGALILMAVNCTTSTST